MALTFDIDNLTFTEDLATGTVTDNTTYGGGEVERADAGVYLIGFKIDKDAVETNLNITNSDPEAATTWTFAHAEDGWYAFVIFVIDDYSGATTYSLGQVVFDPTGDKIYKSLQASNTGQSLSDGAWWEEITVAELYALIDTANEPDNIEYERWDTVTTEYTDKKFVDETLNNVPDIVNDYKLEKNVETYELLGVYLDAMSAACFRGEYSKGEEIARKAEDGLSS